MLTTIEIKGEVKELAEASSIVINVVKKGTMQLEPR